MSVKPLRNPNSPAASQPRGRTCSPAAIRFCRRLRGICFERQRRSDGQRGSPTFLCSGTFLGVGFQTWNRWVSSVPGTCSKFAGVCRSLQEFGFPFTPEGALRPQLIACDRACQTLQGSHPHPIPHQDESPGRPSAPLLRHSPPSRQAGPHMGGGRGAGHTGSPIRHPPLPRTTAGTFRLSRDRFRWHTEEGGGSPRSPCLSTSSCLGGPLGGWGGHPAPLPEGRRPRAAAPAGPGHRVFTRPSTHSLAKVPHALGVRPGLRTEK